MGNLWVTNRPVEMAAVSDGRKVDIDAGVILDEGGLDIQGSLPPDLAAFQWSGDAHVLVPAEAVERVVCAWFALCDHSAIVMRQHPFINDGAPGYVPVCWHHTAEQFG